jgi:hypothetical protein
MTVRRGFKKLFLSTLIPCLVIASASLGGCSSEVGSAPSSKEAAGKPVVIEESKSERSKGSSKAVEQKKSFKSRVLGQAGGR